MDASNNDDKINLRKIYSCRDDRLSDYENEILQANFPFRSVTRHFVSTGRVSRKRKEAFMPPNSFTTTVSSRAYYTSLQRSSDEKERRRNGQTWGSRWDTSQRSVHLSRMSRMIYIFRNLYIHPLSYAKNYSRSRSALRFSLSSVLLVSCRQSSFNFRSRKLIEKRAVRKYRELETNQNYIMTQEKIKYRLLV